MTTLARTAAVAKTRPRPTRHVVLVVTPAARFGGYGAVEIVVGRELACYLLKSIPCDLGQGMVGFELEKVCPAAEHQGEMPVYHVVLDKARGHHSCECLGHLHHSHCKHVDGLLALDKAGRLPRAEVPTPLAGAETEAAALDSVAWLRAHAKPNGGLAAKPRSAAEYAATEPDAYAADMNCWSDEPLQLPEAADFDAGTNLAPAADTLDMAGLVGWHDDGPDAAA